MKVVPVLVVAGGYPSDPVSRGYAEKRLEKEGLLDDPRIDKLGIVDLGEIEMLEALAKTHHDLAKVVTDWKRSDKRDFALRNFLIERYGGRSLRSERTQRRIEEVGDALATRVGRPTNA